MAKLSKLLTDPINLNNPITIQVLGICSALAVTVKLEPAVVMSLSVLFVLAFANVIISLLRNTIPTRIRIIVQLVVIAALCVISSGVWVAVALVKSISTRRVDTLRRVDGYNSDSQIHV